jgi:hypothetical protein
VAAVVSARDAGAIYCGNGDANGGRGHFVARITGPNIEIWCAKCKTFHAIHIADLVRDAILVCQRGDGETQAGELLW